MKYPFLSWSITLGLLVLCACGDGSSSSSSTTGDTVGDSGGVGGAAGSNLGGNTGGDPCTTCNELEECHDGQMCVTKTVDLPDGESIDATEVTRSQYAAWLRTNPPTSAQPSYCSWNASYVPESLCMSNSYECVDSECDNHPQLCVDWCDAYAYCTAAGKRLCGKVGGGPNAFDDYADVTKSEWFKACTSDGVYDYPYGPSYNSKTCNGGGNPTTGCESGTCTTREVGTMSGCVTPDGVYDLSGNAWEWEDSCNGDAGDIDYCRIRGGSYALIDSVLGKYLRCDYGKNTMRKSANDRIGFRCCGP